MPEASTGGVLLVGNNGHITRGNEFEQRAAFKPTYTLTANRTVGMAATSSGIVVFGHQTTPSLPTGVTYQRLQHSDGSTALVRVLSYDLYQGKLYVVGEFADGAIFHFYDGVRVTDWFDGRARLTFYVIAGVETPSASQITNIKVNGVAAISGAVSWATGNEETAAAIAAAINSHTSTPDYVATSSGNAVNIIAATPGAGSNGYYVSIYTADGFTISLGEPTEPRLQGGADSTNSYQPGDFVKTIGQKMYATSSSRMHFSGIREPTKWKTGTVGAGFVDMSSESSGSEILTALARYQNFVAVFASRVVQVWYTDPDPNLNRQQQVLNNTGTSAPRSVTQFGDTDIFYLDQSGLRSLRARDSTNAASTADIGVPVDSLILEKFATLEALDAELVTGLIEPVSGRFWLILKDKVFVFSFFSGANVSAWSTYDLSYVSSETTTSFDMDEALVFNRRVYIRSGDTIFVYGGLDTGDEHDATIAEAWLPYLDGDDPTRKKQFRSIDAAALGVWKVFAAMDPTVPDVEDLVGTLTETTYNIGGRIPLSHASTHISLRFRSDGIGPHKLAACVISFDKTPDED